MTLILFSHLVQISKNNYVFRKFKSSDNILTAFLNLNSYFTFCNSHEQFYHFICPMEEMIPEKCCQQKPVWETIMRVALFWKLLEMGMCHFPCHILHLKRAFNLAILLPCREELGQAIFFFYISMEVFIAR